MDRSLWPVHTPQLLLKEGQFYRRSITRVYPPVTGHSDTALNQSLTLVQLG